MIAPLAGLPLPAKAALPQATSNSQTTPGAASGFEAHLLQPTVAPTLRAPELPALEDLEEVAAELPEAELAQLEMVTVPETASLPLLPAMPQDPSPTAMAQDLSPTVMALPERSAETLAEGQIAAEVHHEPAPLIENEPAPRLVAEAEPDEAPSLDAPAPAVLPFNPARPPADPVALPLKLDVQPENHADAAPEPATVELRPLPGPSSQPTALPTAVTPEAQPLEPAPAHLLPSTSEAPLVEAERLEPTAPPPATTAPRVTPPLLRNVLERLSEIELAEGKTRLLLRPKGLGVLEIDITRHLNGGLQIAIRAENPLLLDALRQESGAMSAFLGDRGFNLAGGEPDLGRYSPPSPEAQNEAGTDLASEASAAEPQDARPPNSLLSGGRIDLIT